jgi:glucose-6-phosphate 1-dehydrogenase
MPKSLLPQPCTLVIFGGSGDLAKRKLLPALYNLALDGVLPEQFAVVGVGRREMSDDAFRAFAREGIEKYSRRDIDPDRWREFEKRIYFHRGDLDDSGCYRELRAHLEEIEPEHGIPGNRVFYLSIPPSSFSGCVEHLSLSGLVSPPESPSFTRIIVEKPVGRDLASARQVNETLARVFHESQTFRIDHYLGKETVQNLLVMRFGNSIFEPLWNQKYIDHVQLTVAEEEGVGTRAGYYEEAGALRDMVQNHILQLLSLVAMEPPWSFDADVVRDHKLAVLRCLRPMTREDVERCTVRAQYAQGFHEGVAVPGYRQEHNVRRDSITETFVALQVHIDNWRWAGVPFYIRTGKRLPRRASEIAVQFKDVPHALFNAERDIPIEPNVLRLRLQPNEGFALGIQAKVPGSRLELRPVEMDFEYGKGFKERPSPEAYERLLLDVMAGDATLYMRRDAVEASWAWIMPILDAWHESDARWLPEYEAGSWGPVEADKLIHGPNRRWREP